MVGLIALIIVGTVVALGTSVNDLFFVPAGVLDRF
jgi:hypothetical protein